jgi:membrane protein implicated in regulation of membrane protease activity
MAGKISGFLGEYVLGLSIITTIIGLLLLFMGIVWYWFKSLGLGFYTDTITKLADWNAYLLIAGFVILMVGVWYLYSYIKHRRFVLKEIKTNKRSELLKKHGELEDTVKHLPSKYKKMVDEKAEELRVK